MVTAFPGFFPVSKKSLAWKTPAMSFCLPLAAWLYRLTLSTAFTLLASEYAWNKSLFNNFVLAIPTSSDVAISLNASRYLSSALRTPISWKSWLRNLIPCSRRLSILNILLKCSFIWTRCTIPYITSFFLPYSISDKISLYSLYKASSGLRFCTSVFNRSSSFLIAWTILWEWEVSITSTASFPPFILIFQSSNSGIPFVNSSNLLNLPAASNLFSIIFHSLHAA